MDIFDILIPVSLASVAFVLAAGIINMWRGGGEAAASRSQMLMRWRVILQAAAVVLVMLAIYFLGR